MSATSSPNVAGHVFGAGDRCIHCLRNRFACAADLVWGCCTGRTTSFEREQLEKIQEACSAATVLIASGRGMGSIDPPKDPDVWR